MYSDLHDSMLRAGEKSKALVLTSTNPRHQFFTSQIAGTFDLVAVICESKRNYYVRQREQSEAIRDHFSKNAEVELSVFPSISASSTANLKTVVDINDPQVIDWAVRLGVDVVCLFGTSILSAGWLAAFPGKIVNLHLGLSPWYRGSATLFWPFADEAVEYLGSTIHLAIEKVDAGDILHRLRPKLLPGRDYYQLTNHLILESIEQFPGVVSRYLSNNLLPQSPEKIEGRICKKNDFDETALARALAYAGNGFSQVEIRRSEQVAQCLSLP